MTDITQEDGKAPVADEASATGVKGLGAALRGIRAFGPDIMQTMDDPDFLQARRDVREAAELLTGYAEALDAEFDRRASLAWTSGGAR